MPLAASIRTVLAGSATGRVLHSADRTMLATVRARHQVVTQWVMATEESIDETNPRLAIHPREEVTPR